MLNRQEVLSPLRSPFRPAQPIWLPDRMKRQPSLETPISLRDYQERGVTSLLRAYYSGRNRTVIEMGTGLGKTRMAMEIFRRFSCGQEPCLFLAGEIDLVHQAYAEALKWFPPEMVGLVQSGYNEVGRWLTIASVETLAIPERREQLLAAQGWKRFSCVGRDEAHQSITQRDREVFDALLGPETLLFGLTATPYRQDRKSLLRFYPDGLVYYVDQLDMITQGYSLYAQAHEVWTDLDLSHIHLEGMYTESGEVRPQLLERMKKSNRYEIAYQSWEHILQRCRTVIYADNIQDCYGFRDYFLEKDVLCEVITGNTPRHIRTDCYQAHTDGHLPILIAFGCLNTGWNSPRTAGAIIGRLSFMGENPNKGLHQQCIGRLLRPSDEVDLLGRPVKPWANAVYLLDKKHSSIPLTMSMGFLPGTTIESARRPGGGPPRSLVDEIEDATGEKMSEEERATINPLEITVRLHELRSKQTSLLIDRGWTKQLNGDWTLATSQGTFLLEQEGMTTYELFLIKNNRRQRITEVKRSQPSAAHQLSSPFTGIDEILARATSTVRRMEVQNQARNGENTTISNNPILQKQLEHLLTRKVYFPEGKENAHKITQGIYYQVEQALKENGSAYRKREGGATEQLCVKEHGWYWRSLPTRPVQVQKNKERVAREKKGRTTAGTPKTRGQEMSEAFHS